MSTWKQAVVYFITVTGLFGLLILLLFSLNSETNSLKENENKQGRLLYQLVKQGEIKRVTFPVVSYEIKAPGESSLSNEKISSDVWRYEHYRMSDMNTYEISYLNTRHVRKMMLANAIEVHTNDVTKPTLSVYVQKENMWNPILYIPMKP